MDRDDLFDKLRHLNYSNGLDYAGESFVHLVNVYEYCTTCDDAGCRKRAIARLERGDDVKGAHCVEEVRKRILLALERRIEEMAALACRLKEKKHEKEVTQEARKKAT